MPNGIACSCPACRLRSVRWPLLLIAAGFLFSLDVIWNVLPIGKTWPALLILWGLATLASRVAPDTGHGKPPEPSEPPFPRFQNEP